MVAQLVTPWQLLSRMRYVSLINMTNLAFPSHGSLHRQLGVFVYMSWVVVYNLCIANRILYSPYLLLRKYEFPNYIATQKNPTDHKLI
jgi:hypothetical protein